MRYQLVAQGTAADLHSVRDYDGYYQAGDRGYLELELIHPAPALAIYQLDQGLQAAGIFGYELKVYDSCLQVHFQKNSPGLGAIAAIIISIAVIVLVVALWRLFRAIPDAPGAVIAWTIGAVVAVILIVVAVAALVRAVKA